MWRRLLSAQFKARKSLPSSPAHASAPSGCISQASRLADSSSGSPSPSVSIFARHHASLSADTGLKKKVEDVFPIGLKKKVEDVFPIVTGHEREELEASLEGRDIIDINHPVGPFGTKEEPAIIKSYYGERLVGCPGGEGEDEHDVVWFRLRKDVPHECSVCSQYFALEVVGPGGSPDGYGDDHHH